MLPLGLDLRSRRLQPDQRPTPQRTRFEATRMPSRPAGLPARIAAKARAVAAKMAALNARSLRRDTANERKDLLAHHGRTSPAPRDPSPSRHVPRLRPLHPVTARRSPFTPALTGRGNYTTNWASSDLCEPWESDPSRRPGPMMSEPVPWWTSVKEMESPAGGDAGGVCAAGFAQDVIACKPSSMSTRRLGVA